MNLYCGSPGSVSVKRQKPSLGKILLYTFRGHRPTGYRISSPFFLSIWLRTTCTNVIGRLSSEIESQNEEQSTYLAYDKRVKQIAEELTQSQVLVINTNL